MSDDPQKLTTLGLARDRFLDSINDSTDDAEGDEIDPEEEAEDLALQQKELAEKRSSDEANRALGLTDDERENLWASFSNRRHLFQFWNLVVGLLFSFGVYLSLMAINKRLAGVAALSEIQLFPSPFLWCFFPAFGGFCLAWDLRVLLWSAFGNNRTAMLYRAWAKRRSDDEPNAFGPSLFNRWFIRLIIVPMGFFTLLALNMHSTLGPDAIRDCGYAFRSCKVLPYADVRRITYVARDESSKNTTGASLVLDFKDGRRWSTGDWGDEIDDVDPAVASLLRQKIALPIANANRIEEIPPLAHSSSAAMK
jgi:hypothetical protein